MNLKALLRNFINYGENFSGVYFSLKNHDNLSFDFFRFL